LGSQGEKIALKQCLREKKKKGQFFSDAMKKKRKSSNRPSKTIPKNLSMAWVTGGKKKRKGGTRFWGRRERKKSNQHSEKRRGASGKKKKEGVPCARAIHSLSEGNAPERLSREREKGSPSRKALFQKEGVAEKKRAIGRWASVKRHVIWGKRRQSSSRKKKKGKGFQVKNSKKALSKR